jgi:hypothetical protein
MKVVVNGSTYLMHWETRKFSPKTGKNIGLELESTDCIIRKVLQNGDLMGVNVGHVSQTACDQANSVTARRLSFVKAIRDINNIPLRKALGHEYNRTCRVMPRTPGYTNRKLKKKVKELQKALSMANSMISSGDSHSEESKRAVESAMS